MDKKSFLLGMLVALLAVPAIGLSASLITTSRIANGAITTAKLHDLAVTNLKMASNSVSNPKLGSSSVTNAKIANKAVNFNKIETVTALMFMNGWMNSGVGTIDFPSIAAQECEVLAVDYSAVFDTVAGDSVIANPYPTTGGVDELNLTWSAWATNASEVTIKVCNPTDGALNPAEQDWSVNVWQNIF